MPLFFVSGNCQTVIQVTVGRRTIEDFVLLLNKRWSVHSATACNRLPSPITVWLVAQGVLVVADRNSNVADNVVNRARPSLLDSPAGSGPLARQRLPAY